MGVNKEIFKTDYRTICAEIRHLELDSLTLKLRVRPHFKIYHDLVDSDCALL